MKNLIIVFSLLLMATVSQAQTIRKGLVTSIMAAGRITDGQEVVAADLPYFKSQGAFFSIMIVPKDVENVKEIEIIKARYYQGEAIRNIPLMVNSWNTVMLVEIDDDNEALFEDYNVYVGFGDDVPGL
ncbi:hypothetical protein [Dyadobacter bucti]|uniref:hypothetical protein n=1 Tax=Dyadobacter bucti TaxID=2572203 RepID=UPI001109FAB6|nr:hypothetical protein [Dyadobacter bucti]